PPLQAPSTRFDWMMLALGFIAFVAVLGLIPLWGTVIARATTQPTPAPRPTTEHLATPTPTSTAVHENGSTPGVATPTVQEQVSVPNLIGQELATAYGLVQEQRLKLTILEEKHDVQVPENHIISQTLPPDSQTLPDSEIGVVVSLGPPVVIMPNTVSFPATIMQLDLKDLDLTVFVTETWSTEPKGLVIAQVPPAGTEIAAGSTVTLTVSSGPIGEIRANLDYKVSLVSCELNKTSFRPGDTLQLDMTWQVLGQISVPYKLFIHVLNQTGEIVTQRDEPPLGGTRPMNTWQSGETLHDLHTFQLPVDILPGRYDILVGLYYGDQRLPVVDPGLARSENDAIVVGQLEIETN
ncbi:MAG: PASTA domain-containing protein, partial [Anaerolineae bacterium]|nr:PASTA domain-containing protein [Anaerolineae bacterium]